MQSTITFEKNEKKTRSIPKHVSIKHQAWDVTIGAYETQTTIPMVVYGDDADTFAGAKAWFEHETSKVSKNSLYDAIFAAKNTLH